MKNSCAKTVTPRKDMSKVNRILQEYGLRVICTDANDFLARCLTDVQIAEQGDE